MGDPNEHRTPRRTESRTYAAAQDYKILNDLRFDGESGERHVPDISKIFLFLWGMSALDPI